MRWLIASLLIAVGVGVGVAVALSTGTDKSSGYASLKQAVVAACDADPAHPVQLVRLETSPTDQYATDVRGDLVQWTARNTRPGRSWLALVARTGGGYQVRTCRLAGGPIRFSRAPAPVPSR